MNPPTPEEKKQEAIHKTTQELNLLKSGLILQLGEANLEGNPENPILMFNSSDEENHFYKLAERLIILNQFTKIIED